MKQLVDIQQLTISVDSKPIVNDITMSLNAGAIHVLMGPNGSGKSSLSYALMGHPHYNISQGAIIVNGQDISSWPAHKRAQAGLFLAFQQPPEIPGVTLLSFLKEAYAARTGIMISAAQVKEKVEPLMHKINLDASFLYRPLNEGFSGGEKKKCELLQMLFFEPPIVILDEIDSGVDIDTLKIIGNLLQERKQTNPNGTLLLITHNPRICSYLEVDYVHLMDKGRLITSDSVSIISQIESKGYDGIRF